MKGCSFPDTYFLVASGTVIYKEYSTDVGDPYYPVPNKRNKELYAKYQVCDNCQQMETLLSQTSQP